MSLSKLAETVNLSIEIPDAEKKVAGRIVLRLERLVRKLNAFNKHLNILYNPFKKHNTVSTDSVEKYRGVIWDYTKQIKENFEDIRDITALCVKDMKYFNSDTHINKLISSFTDDFGDIDEAVLYLTQTVSNWDVLSYKDNVIKSMEVLKKEIAEFQKLIYDRVIDHINSNILSKNWVDSATDKLNLDLREREPAISRLYKEREDKLKEFV